MSTRARAAADRTVAAYAATLFLGASLLFLVEPMAGKSLLPVLGGAPATWSACVLFFQALLLAGYAWAHATARLGTPRQVAAQVAVLAVSVAWLPRAQPGAGAAPAAGQGLLWLAATLGATLGPPFFVLSAGGPVLQRWFSRSRHPSAQDPYFLYAASNAGSLIALVAYPLVVEPQLRLPEQYRLWRLAFAGYAALVAACAVLALRTASARRAAEPPAPGAAALRDEASPARWRDVAGWVALSAVPSSLLLGVTTYLSTDVAAVPLLWVLPLALYLASFVVAFGAWGPAATRLASRGLPTLALLAAMLMVGGLSAPLGLLLPLHLAVFTAAALACHGELARRRPPVSQLTSYYLWAAVGGVLGGAFNALAAPLVFRSVLEYPIALVAACALRPRPDGEREPGLSPRDVVWPVAVFALSVAVVVWADRSEPTARLRAAALAVPVLAASRLASRPRLHAAALALMLLAGRFSSGGYGTLLHAERTFYGVYRVQEDARGQYRVLMSGTTLHGLQSLDPARRGEPLGYYHRRGPLGEALAALPAASGPSVAVVGLGVGSLASYARPGQRWTFFEVDPAVERLARQREYFSYLDACGGRCSVVIGDARHSLSAGPPRAYDLIVLDAFSSDAIPVHLVTREAFELYRSRLAHGGALLVHFSNRDLALEPVLGRLAREVSLRARVRRDPVARLSGGGRLSSEWIAMAEDEAALGGLALDPRWSEPSVPAGAPLWTDDYSNLLGVLRLARTR